MNTLGKERAACGSARILVNEPLRMGFGCDAIGFSDQYPPIARHRDLKPSRRGFSFSRRQSASAMPTWAGLNKHTSALTPSGGANLVNGIAQHVESVKGDSATHGVEVSCHAQLGEDDSRSGKERLRSPLSELCLNESRMPSKPTNNSESTGE